MREFAGRSCTAGSLPVQRLASGFVPAAGVQQLSCLPVPLTSQAMATLRDTSDMPAAADLAVAALDSRKRRLQGRASCESGGSSGAGGRRRGCRSQQSAVIYVLVIAYSVNGGHGGRLTCSKRTGKWNNSLSSSEPSLLARKQLQQDSDVEQGKRSTQLTERVCWA